MSRQQETWQILPRDCVTAPPQTSYISLIRYPPDARCQVVLINAAPPPHPTPPCAYSRPHTRCRPDARHQAVFFKVVALLPTHPPPATQLHCNISAARIPT
jgi:hypothetical protein